jgi:hypothetical protein
VRGHNFRVERLVESAKGFRLDGGLNRTIDLWSEMIKELLTEMTATSSSMTSIGCGNVDKYLVVRSTICWPW